MICLHLGADLLRRLSSAMQMTCESSAAARLTPAESRGVANPFHNGGALSRRPYSGLYPVSAATPRAPSSNKRIFGQDRPNRWRLPTSRDTDADSSALPGQDPAVAHKRPLIP